MKLLQPIILNCAQASTFIQKKENGELGPVDRVRLQIHLAICVFCRQYEKQSARMNEFLDKHFKQDQSSDNELFKTDLKAQIRKKSEE